MGPFFGMETIFMAYKTCTFPSDTEFHEGYHGTVPNTYLRRKSPCGQSSMLHWYTISDLLAVQAGAPRCWQRLRGMKSDAICVIAFAGKGGGGDEAGICRIHS